MYNIVEKSWKRMVTKVTYVGEGFTRKPPKYERFIRPMALRFRKAHVTHPEVSGCGLISHAHTHTRALKNTCTTQTHTHTHAHTQLKATFHLPIIGVKKNPQSPTFTNLGVITKGTVIEVNISELGLVTQSGKVVWGESMTSS